MLGPPEAAPLAIGFALGPHDTRRGGKRAQILPQDEAEALLLHTLRRKVRPWSVVAPPLARWTPLDPTDPDPFLRRAASRYLQGNRRSALVLSVPQPLPLPAAPLLFLQLPRTWAPTRPGLESAAFCAAALSLPQSGDAVSYSVGSLAGPPKLYLVLRLQRVSRPTETLVYGLRHALLVRAL